MVIFHLGQIFCFFLNDSLNIKLETKPIPQIISTGASVRAVFYIAFGRLFYVYFEGQGAKYKKVGLTEIFSANFGPKMVNFGPRIFFFDIFKMAAIKILKKIWEIVFCHCYLKTFSKWM